MIADLHIVATYRLAVPEAGIEAGWDTVYVGTNDQVAKYASNIWPQDNVSAGMVRIHWSLLSGCKLMDHDEVNGTPDGTVWTDQGEPVGELRRLLDHVINDAIHKTI